MTDAGCPHGRIAVDWPPLRSLRVGDSVPAVCLDCGKKMGLLVHPPAGDGGKVTDGDTPYVCDEDGGSTYTLRGGADE